MLRSRSLQELWGVRGVHVLVQACQTWHCFGNSSGLRICICILYLCSAIPA